MSDNQLPDRWIFSFKRTGRRDLTDDERVRVRRLAVRQRLRGVEWGCLAAVCGLGFVLGIAITAGGPFWGWIVIILAVVACLWAIALANAAGHTSLLYRRAYRKGSVDIYTRAEWPPAPGGEDFPQEGDWADDERFEDKIAKQAGEPPTRIETPPNDAVLITVDGKIVSRVIDLGKPEPLCDEEEKLRPPS